MRCDRAGRFGTRKWIFRLSVGLALATAAFTASGCAIFRTGFAKHPSVLLVVASGVAQDDLGCYGGTDVATPNLDRLAAEGVRFTDAYTADPSPTLAWAATLTGKYPARLNLTDPARASDPAGGTQRPFVEPPRGRTSLANRMPTLAGAFAGTAYETALFGGWDLGARAEPYGFDSSKTDSDAQGQRGEQDPEHNDRLTSLAGQFLEENGKRHFFLCVHYYPSLPPKPALAQRYAAQFGNNKWGAKEAAHAARVADLDANVGQLLEKLDKLRLQGKVIVAFVTAGGRLPFEWVNPPAPSAAGSLSDGSLRVPLIVRWPGARLRESATPTTNSAVSDAIVSSLDVGPTLLDAAGLDAKELGAPAIDGVSFADILRGGPVADRRPVCWHQPFDTGAAPNAGAVRSGDWKLIEFFGDMHVALYNLADDPSENKNLATHQPEKVAELCDLLHRWRAAVGARMLTQTPAYRPGK